MNKKLKLFGLLALTLALGAGAAWAAFVNQTLNGTTYATDMDLDTVGAGFNQISGYGKVTGGITTAAGAGDDVLKFIPTAEQVLDVAPAAGKRIVDGANKALQLMVDGEGKVILRGSNNDNPTNAIYTSFDSTLVKSGTLTVTNNDSLSNGWVALAVSATEAKAPVFGTETATEVLLGGANWPGVNKDQPLYLAFVSADNPWDPDKPEYKKLTYAVVDTVLGGNLKLNDGIDQRFLHAESADLDAGTNGDNLASVDAFPNGDKAVMGFARLIKTGEGSLVIQPEATTYAVDGKDRRAVDGAHHRGGTVVKEGIIEVIGGNAPTGNKGSHFRASLGRTWNAFNGSELAPAGNFDPKWFKENVSSDLYNPLFIKDKAKVVLDRSQFFSDFNTDKETVFEGKFYLQPAPRLEFYPQIAVTLDRKDSHAKGLLKGDFDLVVFSANANERPSNDPQHSGITDDAQSIFFIDNEENQIGEKRETLVANGVLEIAGAKSIGGGKVTVGADKDRGFETAILATFAASKTFHLPNETETKVKSALAAELDAVLSFKDITVTNDADRLRINPVELSSDAKLPKNWMGTVLFGAPSSEDGKYSWTGVMRKPNLVDIDRGVWQLNSYPVWTAAQVAANENPFAEVDIKTTGTLSLGEGVRDFSKLMDVTITDDSRIRMVVKAEDVAHSRAEALKKDAIFMAREMDYTDLLNGPAHKDRRLGIQLDISKAGTLKKGDWIRAVGSERALGWNNLHYLRDNSTTKDEDYSKTRIGLYGSDGKLIKDLDAQAVGHVDEHGWSIMVEITSDVTDDGAAPAPEKDLKATVTAPAEVKVGSMVTFELGKWTYTKASGDVEVQDVKWMLDGVDKTADVKADKLTVKAEKEGTMNLVVTSKLKADPTVDGEAKASVAVKKDVVSSGGSGGGCDAGFAGLALLLAAPLFLRKRD